MILAALTTALLMFLSQDPGSKPKAPDRPPQDAHSQMNERGEHAMAFSQTATTHHFLLKPDGGVIQVEVKDPKDTTNRDNIRMHLGHIAKMFANGDFDIPMFVHDTVPPGVPEMKQLQKSIHYTFEETPNGGRVVIATTDKTAVDAVHKFLRFQIQEHRTGDPQETFYRDIPAFEKPGRSHSEQVMGCSCSGANGAISVPRTAGVTWL